MKSAGFSIEELKSLTLKQAWRLLKFHIEFNTKQNDALNLNKPQKANQKQINKWLGGG